MRGFVLSIDAMIAISLFVLMLPIAYGQVYLSQTTSTDSLGTERMYSRLYDCTRVYENELVDLAMANITLSECMQGPVNVYISHYRLGGVVSESLVNFLSNNTLSLTRLISFGSIPEFMSIYVEVKK